MLRLFSLLMVLSLSISVNAQKKKTAVADPKKVHTFGAGFNITPAGGQPQKQVRQVAPRH